ncbi:MAG: alpha/beta hydrolase [Erysipelotrichaceae bacterium]|nr:alpha/beta hydrolase [Erysipelotrichaceae bacterium]
MQKYYEITTSKGTMRGYFHQPDKDNYPVCLIFHGFTGLHTGTKFAYVTISRLLEEKGIGSVRLDFLGTGDSDLSFKEMTFKDELESAKIILNEISNLPQVTDIYLLGHSMGGAVASELAKLYPNDILKMCLWAPALNLSDALEYLKGHVQEAPSYDHNGFEISNEFVEDIIARDFYKDLDTYKNPLMIIHGTKDTTVPYDISNKYLKGYYHPEFHPILDATHNYDNLNHINEVIDLTIEFLTKDVELYNE